jgi:uncharacterized membrane protein
MTPPLINSPAGILASLCGICAFFFLMERVTRWKLFQYLPPLVFIYLIPVVLSNVGVLPTSSATYDVIKSMVLPMMLVLLLLKVDVAAAIRVMGKGVFVMFMGTAGVVIGAPLAYWLVKDYLGPEGWKAFGTLAGSWIGGTGNMAGVSEMIGTGGTEFGLAVLADTLIYLVWLPIMLGSKNLEKWFANFANVDADRLARMDEAAKSIVKQEAAPELRHYLYLAFIGLSVTWLADGVASWLPEVKPYVDQGTWRILLVTTVGIGLSFTPAKSIPGSHAFAMALVYLFVARMGAVAALQGVADQAIPFLLAALLWIFLHGGFCVLGALVFRVDIHTAAIASAANVGGAASAPIVAAHHKENLVPASILMALLGYAVGNYAAYFAAVLCSLVQRYL